MLDSGRPEERNHSNHPFHLDRSWPRLTQVQLLYCGWIFIDTGDPEWSKRRWYSGYSDKHSLPWQKSVIHLSYGSYGDLSYPVPCRYNPYYYTVTKCWQSWYNFCTSYAKNISLKFWKFCWLIFVAGDPCLITDNLLMKVLGMYISTVYPMHMCKG